MRATHARQKQLFALLLLISYTQFQKQESVPRNYACFLKRQETTTGNAKKLNKKQTGIEDIWGT